MKDNFQDLTTLHELLDYNARLITDAEITLRNGLQNWVNRASSVKLKEILMRYGDYIHRHIDKMGYFFTAEKLFPINPGNRVMKSLVIDTDEKLAICSDTKLRDACLLASLQEINHYKISVYGTAASYAHTLGMIEMSILFHEAEISEKQIDDRLTQLAEYETNPNANTVFSIAK